LDDPLGRCCSLREETRSRLEPEDDVEARSFPRSALADRPREDVGGLVRKVEEDGREEAIVQSDVEGRRGGRAR
jgi:hypothetical protein